MEKPEDIEIDGNKPTKFKDCFYRDWHDYWLDKKSENTEVLFLAESPPKNGLNYFFYTGKNSTQNGLVGGLLTPLFIENDTNIKDKSERKRARIKKFVEKYWLEDIFPKPIDEVNGEDIEDIKGELIRTIENINPKKILIFLPKGKMNHRNVIRLFKSLNIYEEIDNNDISNKKKQELLLTKLTENTGSNIEASTVAAFPSNGAELNEKTFRLFATENKGFLGIAQNED